MPVIAEDNIILRILAETKKARRDIDRLDKDVEDLGESTNSVNDQFAKLGKFAKNAAIVAVIAKATQGMVRLAKESSKLYAEFERSNISFEVLIGNATRAKELVQDIIKFSKDTPFEAKDVEQAAKTILGYGRNVESVMDDIRLLGEVSAATGSNLSQVALVYSQVFSLGKLQARDALQFIDAGVPIYNLLSESLGKSVAELQKLQEQGKITFEDLNRAFKEAAEEGGSFYQAIEKQSNTIFGLQAKVNEGWEIMLRTIGSRLAPVIRSTFRLLDKVLTDATEKLADTDDDFFLRIAAGLDATSESLTAFSNIVQSWVGLNVAQFKHFSSEVIGAFLNLRARITQDPAYIAVADAFAPSIGQNRDRAQTAEKAYNAYKQIGKNVFNNAYKRAIDELRKEAANDPDYTGSLPGDLVTGGEENFEKAKEKSKDQIDELFDINYKYFVKVRDRFRNQAGKDNVVPFLESIIPGISGRNLEQYRQKGSGKDNRSLIERIFGVDGDVQKRIFQESGDILLESARHLTNSLVDEEIRRTDLLLQASDDRLRQLQQIAGEGNAEQLQLEEERQRTLLQRREEYIQQQQRLNAIEISASNAVTVANMLEGIAKTFSANPILGILQGAAAAGLIASTIASVNAALSSVPAYWTGTEFVNGDGGIDNVPAMLSKGERVVDRNTNKQLNAWGVKNDDLVPLIGSALGKYQPTSLYQGGGVSNKEFKEMKRGLAEVKEAIYGIAFNVNIDQDGIGVAAGNYRNRMNKRKNLMS